MVVWQIILVEALIKLRKLECCLFLEVADNVASAAAAKAGIAAAAVNAI